MADKKFYLDFKQAFYTIKSKTEGRYTQQDFLDELKEKENITITLQTLRNVQSSVGRSFGMAKMLSEKSGIPLTELIKEVK